MGVRYLTTFIQKHSDVYMDNIELHNTNLIIDGCAIAHHLYTLLNPMNCCFNGDYDRYGQIVRNFFELLERCKITPYLMMDGSFEDKKTDTIISRMQQRIESGQNATNLTDVKHTPLLIIQTFEDIARELKLNMVRCDFEADKNVAHIAKLWNCPVLSNDSDFFIFDVQYIPLTNFSLNSETSFRTDKTKYEYIPCKLYRRKSFLRSAGIREDTLYLFVGILGNDYTNPRIFQHIYQTFRGPDYVDNVIKFLENETLNCAIRKVANFCHFRDEREILDVVTKIIEEYTIKSEFNEYIHYFNHEEKDCSIDDKIIRTYLAGKDVPADVLRLFLKRFRKVLYPACFIAFLLKDCHFVQSQVEDIGQRSSHYVSMDLMQAIHELLWYSKRNLTVWQREGRVMKEFVLPQKNRFKRLREIQIASGEERRHILFQAMKIGKHFDESCLQHFPESWKLYILVIKYLFSKHVLTWPVIQSLLLCKIIINYVDKQLKVFTRSPDFKDKYKKEICAALISKESKKSALLPNTIKASTNINYEDSLIAMKNLMPFFQTDSQYENRKLVHILAQFQSCAKYIKYLNQLLNFCFSDLHMGDSFNGTFIHNFARELIHQKQDYVGYLLENSESVLNCYRLMLTNLENYL